MAEQEDSEITSPHENITATTTNRTTLAEINLKTTRTALLQARLQRKIHSESGRKGGEVI